MSEGSPGRAHSGIWLIADTVGAAVFSFGFFVISARYLSSIEFGVGALAISFAQILTPMIESLFHDALIQRRELDDRYVRTASTLTLGWALLLAALTIASAPLLAGLLHAPKLRECMPWLALGLIGSGVMAVPAALSRRAMNFRLLAVRTLLARTLATAVGVWMLLTGWGIWAMIAQFSLSTIIAAIFVAAVARISWRPGISCDLLKSMLAFAGPAMGTQALLFANGRIVTLMVGGLLGPAAAGAWNVAFRFVEPLQALVATTAGQMALPIYARMQGDLEDMRNILLWGTHKLAILTMPLFIGLAVCSEPVIRLFLGDKWITAAPSMTIICLVTALVMSRQLSEIVFTSLGRPHRNLRIHAEASALSMLGVALGAGVGVLGVTIGWASRLLPFTITAPLLLRRDAALPLRRQFGAISRPLVASGAMAIAVMGVRMALPEHAPVAPVLIAMIAAGGIAYVFVLLAIDPLARMEIRPILRRLRRNRPAA